ncbi:MAG: mechanosensitive ion channel family protein [Thomasclavelia sp.]|uniref:mechanosensitive ion channel family protein n=1 Tax=Thomasclavelia sp. TaxID=3025757 RepID=UPI0039A3088C
MESIYKQIDSIFEHGLIKSGVNILILIIIVLIINKLINRIMKKKITDPIKLIFPMRIKKIILVTIILATIMSEISAMQSIIKALLASGGILAVIVGLASQEAASNIINGFMIMTYKPYKIGDFVNVKEYNVIGTVIDISMRHSIVETIERTQVIVPNTIMNKSIIENISNVKAQKANHLFIEVSYECDLQKAITIIQEESAKHPLCLDARTEEQKKRNESPVNVHCVEFNDSGIQLRATVLSKDNATGFQLLSDLRLSIKARFDQEKIEIPYPHRVVINEVRNTFADQDE